MACSASESLGFNDDACQRCPVVQFTCPPSGVFSALTGSYPHFEEDFAVPPSACRPTLIKLSNSAGGGAGTIGFEAIYPILVTHCARCHGEGGLATLLDLPELASSDIEVAFEAARAHADILLAQISSGAMPPDSCTGRPPGSDGCVSAEDFELMRKWFVAGTPR
jgi:hypothetical protein